ncbi:hypothetical protein SPAN111604_04995 [Sphingomonas antarctica]|uniref:hypothetical protein n=1 Tax=Sphingomonas antarctica TaxID=2040274 RepID=UPI0039EA278B
MALLLVIVVAVVIFNEPDVADVIAATPVAEREAPKPKQRSSEFMTYAPVNLPSGLPIDRGSILNYDLATWLATGPTSPRTFMFDRLGFDPSSAAIRDEDRPFLQVLSQILTAYPQARVTITANGPGSLAEERSVSIRDALLALAADPNQLNIRAGDGSEGAPGWKCALKWVWHRTSTLDAGRSPAHPPSQRIP